jgi:hypothetical protein
MQCATVALEIVEKHLAHLRPEFLSLEVVVDGFDGFVNANRDEQANDNGRDMNEKALPRERRLVHRMNLAHCWYPSPQRAVC